MKKLNAKNKTDLLNGLNELDVLKSYNNILYIDDFKDKNLFKQYLHVLNSLDLPFINFEHFETSIHLLLLETCTHFANDVYYLKYEILKHIIKLIELLNLDINLNEYFSDEFIEEIKEY